MPESLCETCTFKREVVSDTGSRFLLCELSRSDRRFPKYPPQPVIRCDGYVRRTDEDSYRSKPRSRDGL